MLSTANLINPQTVQAGLAAYLHPATDLTAKPASIQHRTYLIAIPLQHPTLQLKLS
ncbi:MAG TPA: hypothetical protein IGS53_00495 [Leptolyngbyaceae cyanobacterium M33_DOE_097]|nr:hypothetical protein [Leptolyngbyaceae cyanobacterium M33_DOE_097]